METTRKFIRSQIRLRKFTMVFPQNYTFINNHHANIQGTYNRIDLSHNDVKCAFEVIHEIFLA